MKNHKRFRHRRYAARKPSRRNFTCHFIYFIRWRTWKQGCCTNKEPSLWLAKQKFKYFTTKHELEHQLRDFIFNISLPQLLCNLQSLQCLNVPQMVTTDLEPHSSNCQGSTICIPGVSTHPTQSSAECAYSFLQHFVVLLPQNIITPSPYFEPGVLRLCVWRPLQIYTTLKFAFFHFRFKSRWLAAIYYANPLFIMAISYLICSSFIYAHCFRNATTY